MTKTLAIVGARLNSSRLAGKHLLPLAGEPMISRLWQRLMQCQEVNCSELATTADEFNHPLVNWAREKQVDCYPYEGDVNDLMARLDSIIQRRNPAYVLYICGDCPLIDPEFIDYGLRGLKSSGKDSIKLKQGVVSIHEGITFFSRRGWEKLMSVSQCAISREHVGYGDKLTPILERLSIPDSDDFSKVSQRISVDTEADYRFMAELYSRWFKSNESDSIVSLSWVQQQLMEDATLRGINGHVHQKVPNIEYKKVAIYCHVGKSIGIGHLKRAEIIAKTLQEHSGTGTTVNALASENSHVPTTMLTIEWYANERTILEALKNDKSPLVILDFHPSFINLQRLRSILRDLRVRKTKIVGIDKLYSLLPELDLLYIPSFFSLDYSPKIFYGWESYLFPKRQEHKKNNQILVLTGGSDALGYGKDLPLKLSKITTDWPIIWVQGPLAPTPNIIKNSNIKVIKNPENINELIEQSEIIITCYGLSLFESIFNQSATILLPPKNLCSQTELDHLMEERCCLLASSVSDVIKKLNLLLNDKICRSKLQKESLRVFRGHNGLSTLANKLHKLL